MLRAQFDVHKTGVDLGSNLSGTPPKLDFIQYKKKGKNRMVLFCSIFVKPEYKKWCISVKNKFIHVFLSRKEKITKWFWTKWCCGHSI